MAVSATILIAFAFLFYVIGIDIKPVLQFISDNMPVFISIIFLIAWLAFSIMMLLRKSRKMNNRTKILRGCIGIGGYLVVFLFIVVFANQIVLRIIGWILVPLLIIYAMGFPIMDEEK
jgi:hypothetical protein